MKAILPPKSVDTAEELAQLSQYVINIVDFRDPDGTMTHWVNPDVMLRAASIHPPPGQYAATDLAAVTGDQHAAATVVQLDQYGMEYNPVAINEVLAIRSRTKCCRGSGG